MFFFCFFVFLFFVFFCEDQRNEFVKTLDEVIRWINMLSNC